MVTVVSENKMAAVTRGRSSTTTAAMSTSSRSTVRSPLFLSVNKKTPVTVHIRPTSTKSKIQQGEAASRRPGKRTMTASHISRASQTRDSHRGVAGGARQSSHGGVGLGQSSQSSRRKASAQSLQPRFSWEGSTHRLEIHTPRHSTAVGDEEEEERGDNALRMSDLNDNEVPGHGGEEEEEERKRALEHEHFESRIQSLQSEVDQLTARLEEEQRRHSLHNIPLTRSSLHRHDTAPSKHQTPAPPSTELKVLGQVASLMSSQLENQRREEERAVRKKREELKKRLEEVERQSGTVTDGVDQLHTSLKKLGKRQSTCAVMSQLGGQRSKLMQNLAEFKRDSRQLRKMLREQLVEQESHPELSSHSTTAATTTADARLALHTQGLHDELGRKEVELQSLMVHTQSVEEQLLKRDEEYAKLQSDLHEYKRQSGQEREALKRRAKEYKKRAVESEHAVDDLGQELEETRAQLTELGSERTQQETQLSSLSTRVRDLDNCLTQSKATAESAVEAVSTRLSEKTKELNILQVENERLKTTMETIEGALKALETNSSTKISSLENELEQTRTTSTQYEALSEEYKAQLDRCRQDCEETQRELRRREREMETLQEDTSAEMEKCRRRFEQQLAELEPLPQLLKMSELRVREAQQRLTVCDQRLVEQSRLVEELTAKCDRQTGIVEEMRHRLSETETENRALHSKLEIANRRVEEADGQNREMVAAARQREENMQQLKGQVEEYRERVISLQTQLQNTESEAQRQQDKIRDKAAGKERAQVARIADLETQLNKSNSLNGQLRRSKEDADRQHQSRLRSLQEQLDTANASRRSMETYINFLKASYSSLCSEAGSNSAPPFHMLN